jgi:hypothetical protein
MAQTDLGELAQSPDKDHKYRFASKRLSLPAIGQGSKCYSNNGDPFVEERRKFVKVFSGCLRANSEKFLETTLEFWFGFGY